VTDPQPTGNPQVDAALVDLDRFADQPPAEQVDGYEQVQRSLHQTLTSLDETR